MPELPDVVVYVEALAARIVDHRLQRVRIGNPFLVRSVDPPVSSLDGTTVTGVERLGKRIVIACDTDLFAVVHLMVAGRLRWRHGTAAIPKRNGVAAFDFDNGTVLFTEASKKRRASLHVVRGRDQLVAFDRGGLETLACDLATFRERLTNENHTLKRALTDPRLFSGIGNAYSDEILHAAQLSPLMLTSRLSSEQIERLYHAVRDTLAIWIDRHRMAVGDGFPEKVTAFRPEMAVHGRYGQPCPTCESPVQRIRYAENEVNYCATCQTGGKVLADRAFSRLLKEDWPRSIDEWEDRLGGAPS